MTYLSDINLLIRHRTVMKDDDKSTISSGAIAIAALTWGAILLGVLFVIGYLSCQHTDERIMQCISAGHNPIECHQGFNNSR